MVHHNMDIQSLLTQIIQWHKESQHEPIVQLLEILVESSSGFAKDLDQSIAATKEIAAQQAKSSILTYFGDSLQKLKYHRRALRAYEQALALSDTSSRRASKRKATINSNCDISRVSTSSINCNENELRHRIHLCHYELQEYKEAKRELERIPPVERNVKILVSLADLYCLDKNVEKARETFLEIIKQDPLRLDIVTRLCRVGGCKAVTILSLIPEDVKKSCPWYPSWIQAQCYLYSSDSQQAIRSFETLTSRFERKASILTKLAEAYYLDGKYSEAIRVFKVAYENDPLTLAGVGAYAACLDKKDCRRSLEDLADRMSSRCTIEGEYFPEPWLALAYYYANQNKREGKALLFVQKAYKLDRNCIEALILIATLCLEKKDSSKAIPYIVTAHTQAPYRFEVLRVLCEAFLANNKKTAAVNYAKASLKSLGETARAYYLWADIMLKASNQRYTKNVKNCLEKAVKLDSLFLPALFELCRLLKEEQKYDRVIEMLQHAMPHYSDNCSLHYLLAHAYKDKGDDEKALSHQSLAHDLERSAEHKNTERPNMHRPPATSWTEPNLGFESDELYDHGDSDEDT